MGIERLSADIQRALQSISNPARYLFPGPEHSSTGPLDQTQLLIGAAKNGASLRRPGFHRFFRMLEQLPDLYVEHFIHPISDYVRMTRDRNVDPWALESRRSVFSFDTWICPLSWPGDWIQLKTLLDTLRSYENDRSSTTLVCIVPTPSFPLLDDISTHADVTLAGPSLPNTPEALQDTFLKLQNQEESSVVTCDDLGTNHENVLPHENWSQPLTPIPFVGSDVLHQYWIGQTTSYDQNHSLQFPTRPTFHLPSPSNLLDELVQAIDQQGFQHVTLGPVVTQQNPNTNRIDWQLEFLERFHARWGERPICYQLDNPRPDHPVWTYDHLIDRYNHTSLHAHLGEPDSGVIQDTDIEVLDRWLTFFLSAGGPGMTFSVDVDVDPDEYNSITHLCHNLQSANRNCIDGKGQFTIEMQPQLSLNDTWPTTEQLHEFQNQIQAELSDVDIRMELNIPDFYEEMRSVRSPTAAGTK